MMVVSTGKWWKSSSSPWTILNRAAIAPMLSPGTSTLCVVTITVIVGFHRQWECWSVFLFPKIRKKWIWGSLSFECLCILLPFRFEVAGLLDRVIYGSKIHLNTSNDLRVRTNQVCNMHILKGRVILHAVALFRIGYETSQVWRHPMKQSFHKGWSNYGIPRGVVTSGVIFTPDYPLVPRV